MRGDGYVPVPTQAVASVDRPEVASPKSDYGLSVHDSFILDVLRGWRLLVAASLTQEEWRDVLSSTGNRLDCTLSRMPCKFCGMSSWYAPVYD